MRRSLAIGAGGLLALACGSTAEPRPQWHVEVVTDAPLPHFADRVRVDLVAESGASACTGCTRLFDASPGKFPLSFGVVPPEPRVPLWVRARLFRGATVGSDGAPSGGAFIDITGKLPSDPSRVGLELPMDCFGVVDGEPFTSCAPTTQTLVPAPELGPPAVQALEPGAWAAAASVPCGNVPTDMVCVPGGAFILGEPTGPPYADAADARPERLVVLSPFALDAAELTVGKLRSLASQLSSAPTLADPKLDPRVGCTYSPSGINDDLPVNCLDRTLAAEVCALMGKRLPTEAEWEYAASGAGAESTFPWGEDEDVCDYATIALGDVSLSRQDPSCRAINQVISPGLVAGGNPLDRTALGLVNMAGNVAEWVEDDYALYDAPCWTAGPQLKDPVCVASSARASVRGGSWKSGRQYARAAARSSADTGDSGTGVRCAKSAGGP
ncbi:MAG: SUMF1/EgtB/PvdO family nonheme iron enzyme [Myxococcales bacterium]|nr:SUMF1/EgtB/PvdO family nonheme iron enzyme [Myxococcales bacterium]